MRALLERSLTWLWVAVVAFLLADLTAAGIEDRLALPAPSPTPSKRPAANLPSAPAAAIPGELVAVLDTRPPEAFIEPGSPDAAAAPGEAQAPAAPMSLTLKGTILGAGGLSLAVVDDGSGETRLLSPGETLGDMVLVDVGAHVATFRRGSETRTFSLLETSDSAPSSVNRVPTAANTPVAPASPSQPIKPPETMAELRELLDDPAKASRGFKLTPINRKGSPYGVMLEFRQSSNLMSAIGMRHGDILLSINGRSLRSTEDMYTAYQEMRNNPTVSFEIDRGGQVVPVKFELKE